MENKIKENRAKKTDIVTTIGLVVNGLALCFAVYVYYTTIPKVKDLKPRQEVKNIQISNPKVEQAIGKLNRSSDLPINIDPNDLGKANPYNF